MQDVFTQKLNSLMFKGTAYSPIHGDRTHAVPAKHISNM